jgi:amphi-Trp domain-containing protein
MKNRSFNALGEAMGKKQDRDVERVYSTSEFVSKLRRLADALERRERFEIQVAGERVYVPARAEFNVEHEREGSEEEIEFQLKWTNP